MIFAIPAILLIVSPIASMTYAEGSAFCKIGACLNANKDVSGTGAWPSNIVNTVNNVCNSALGGDGNVAAACAALKRGMNGQRQLTTYEKSTVTRSLNAFGDVYQWDIVNAFGGLSGLINDASGKYCWSLHLNRGYGNAAACN